MRGSGGGGGRRGGPTWPLSSLSHTQTHTLPPTPQALVATRSSGAALLADADAALADLATDVARARAARGGKAGPATHSNDHRTHPAVTRLAAACPLPGLAAYVASAPGPLPRPPRGRAAALADRLSVATAALATGAAAATRAAAAADALAGRSADDLVAAAGRCPGIDWGAGGGGSEAGAATATAAAPAVAALLAAALATTAALRSRVAAALVDPALLEADPRPPLASYALLWGLAPCVDEGLVRAGLALEVALVGDGG